MGLNAKMPAAEDFFTADGKGFSSAAIHYLGNLEKSAKQLNELLASGALEDEIDGQFKYPENGTEIIIADTKYARHLIELTTYTQAGTATVTPKIGSTTLGGGASSATTVKSTVSHSSANAMAIHDTLSFVLSSVSSDCSGLAWSLKFTRDVLA